MFERGESNSFFVFALLFFVPIMNNLAFASLFLAASGEGCSALSVPGHRSGDEEPLAEVFAGSCLLLLPGLCGGRQPCGGHQGAAAAGHH